MMIRGMGIFSIGDGVVLVGEKRETEVFEGEDKGKVCPKNNVNICVFIFK